MLNEYVTIHDMNTHKFCIICSSFKIEQLKEYYLSKGLIKCADCGFVFMEQIPSQEELNKHYSSYSYDIEGYLSPLTIDRYNKLLDEFEKYRKNNRILDVGCGRGWFLEVAKKRGWEVFGTEFSDVAIQIGKQKGLNIIQGSLEELRGQIKQEFDVITSFEVIEHINNPKEEMAHIYSLLRSSGLFYCTTPNFNSLNRLYLKQDFNIIEYPEHLSYYTRKTLRSLMQSSGFKDLKILTTGVSITRIKLSKKLSQESLVSENSTDEVIRRALNKNGALRFAKFFLDRILSILGLGMTLKGYFIKK